MGGTVGARREQGKRVGQEGKRVWQEGGRGAPLRVAGTGATIVLPLTHAPGLHGAQPLTGVPPCTEQPPLAQRQVTE